MGDEVNIYHKMWTKEISSHVGLVPVDHLFFGMRVSLISGRKIILVTNKVLIFQFRDLMNEDRMIFILACFSRIIGIECEMCIPHSINRYNLH